MPELLPNTKLSHYRIVSKIGEGGMGEVYLAEDTRLERKVAIKFLSEEYSRDEERLRRFTQEAKAVSALNHPNILTIHEIGESESRRFIASEFINGETLRERIAGQPLDLHKTLEIAIQIASALQAAHASSIVHRDIKPDNVMLREDGLVKVLDFGLAKLTEQQTSGTEEPTRQHVRTRTGTILGTAVYMSPEQTRGKSVDARTDIWSLGVVLYEMLTKRRPFEGETDGDIIATILRTEPVPPSKFNAVVPAELDRIIKKTLKKKSDERYQTANDLLIDLKGLKHDLEFTAELERTASTNENAAETKIANAATADTRRISTAASLSDRTGNRKIAIAGLAVLLLAALGFGYWYYSSQNTNQIESIAVMPFVNESGNPDNEYLSDGMTDALINSLSQLPDLGVRARSSVFRYKGKDLDARTIGKELGVQAALHGRVVQRGDDLTLFLELVDAQTGNRIWGDQYVRKQKDLISLQNEIARDVAENLKVKLSGADQQKLAKNYAANPEAYQLYLRGLFQIRKFTPSEIHKGISYFEQAIAMDPNYAPAYYGISEAYGNLALSSEMRPTESLPKAKLMAQKALEIDGQLSDGYQSLGAVSFWYDWDWQTAENQFKRSVELNPNNARAYVMHAHVLSNTGRHEEALTQIQRARELEPLNLFVNSIEGQFLIHAGRTDEALARLLKTNELEPNFWMPHLFASSAYVEKGMYAEAVREARRAKELSPVQTTPATFECFALVKSGRRDEARALLSEMLKLTQERYVPAYHIALMYNALDEKEEAFAWLEKGLKERDPKMTFLMVEPKWNNLRVDPRFQDLLRLVGFPQ